MKAVRDFAKAKGVNNVLTFAAVEDNIFKRVTSETGYQKFTTFFSDLSIADWFGVASIKDTHTRVVRDWLDDYKYFTEYVMALNHKSWEWNSRGVDELSRLYADLYYQADELFCEHYADNEEAKRYYFEVTD